MPSLASVVNRFAKQDLLYWEKVASDGSGRPVYADPGSPAELKCRWEDRVQEVLAGDGRKALSKAYLLLTTRLVPGSLVFLGTLADWRALARYPEVPSKNEGGSEVMVTQSTPDLKAVSTIYESYL